MTQKARVTSVDAIREFRANLIHYVSKARPTLEEISGEVLRTRAWLESDRRVYWQNEVRKRRRVLEEAQQTLFGLKISNLREVSFADQQAVRKAKTALEEAEEKVRRINHWLREMENRLSPMVRQLDKVHTLLSNDLTMAVVYLAQVVQTLDEYSEIATAANPASAAAETRAAEPTATPEKP